MKLYNGYTEEKMKMIREHPYFAPTVSKTVENAEAYLLSAPAEIKYTDLHLFVETGDRKTYERAYSNLRARTYTFFNAYLFTEREEYLVALCNAIWSLCNVESWANPAHVSEKHPMDVRRRYVDISAATVARRLAEIYACLGDKLPSLIRRRIEYEIRERIIRGYEEDDFWWKRSTNNWSAVCAAGVLASYVYIASEEECRAAIPGLVQVVDYYLTGFGDDGCCREGFGYWKYGFSLFCMFAEMLKNYTDGEINYFENPKVHAIAKFQENMAINDTECISFSDSTKKFVPEHSLSHFLKGMYPDVQIPSISVPSEVIELSRLLWLDPSLAESKMKPKSIIYKDAQWFIYRSDAYNFVCKAGSNSEPHNHNDIGSFMISKGGRVTFTDPGSGKYTRQYFSKTERYDVFEPSARAHSVPIIDGIYQIKREGESVIYKESEREYAFSMENGYNIPILKSLTRQFLCEDGGVLLRDSFELDAIPESVAERFVTFFEPVIEQGRITVGESVLIYDADTLTPELSTGICNHETPEEILYMIDLKLKEPSKSFALEFKFI